MLLWSYEAAFTLLAGRAGEQDLTEAALAESVAASAGVSFGATAPHRRSSRIRLLFDRDRTVVLATRVRRRRLLLGEGAVDGIAKASFVTTPGGEELAVVARAQYERLAAAAAAHAREREAERAEIEAEEALVRHREAAWIDAGRPTVAPDVLRRVRAGDSYMKAFRTARKLTQAQLAARTGLAQGYLSEIETARKPPSEEAAARIAVALGIHPVFLSPAAPPADGAG